MTLPRSYSLLKSVSTAGLEPHVGNENTDAPISHSLCRSQKSKPVENEESWLGTARYGPFGPPDKPVFESWKVWEETILP